MGNCNTNGNTCNNVAAPTDVTSTGAQAPVLAQQDPTPAPVVDTTVADVSAPVDSGNADPNAAPSADPNAADPMAVTVQCKDMPDDMFCAVVDQVRQAIQGCGVEVDMSFAVKTWLTKPTATFGLSSLAMLMACT